MPHLETMTADVHSDHVRRFVVEHQPVRGHWVHLKAAWRELRAHGDYPPPVRSLLGQAVAASVLLAATLKFRGRLTLQLQGNGAVGLMVAQCTHDFRVRAIARFDEGQLEALGAERPGAGQTFRSLAGSEGRFTVTIEADERSLRYQGIVPLTGESLAESLEAYFAASEQLPTRVRLAADEEHSAGLLVQKLPETAGSSVGEAWDSARRGFERLTARDLLRRPVEDVLGRGLPAHDLRLFRGSPVQFECRCGEGRVTALLRALGPEEVRDVLREQGEVTVTCEFCRRLYHFDAEAVDALFADSGKASPLIH